MRGGHLGYVHISERPAVKREAEEDWGGDMRAQPLFLKGPKLSQIKRDHAYALLCSRFLHRICIGHSKLFR